jgi:hypothetical protein
MTVSPLVVVRNARGNKLRRVPLYPDAQWMLKQYIEEVRCPLGQPSTGSPEASQPLLSSKVVSKPGQPFEPGITATSLQCLVRQLGHRAAQRLREEVAQTQGQRDVDTLLDMAHQLETATPQVLRNSLARRVLEAGATLPEVQQVLGPQSVGHHRPLSYPHTGGYCTSSSESGCLIPPFRPIHGSLVSRYVSPLFKGRRARFFINNYSLVFHHHPICEIGISYGEQII